MSSVLITFDDLPFNTVVTEQYASKGIHFKPTKIDWDYKTPFMPQVLSSSEAWETDLPKHLIEASFTSTWHSVVNFWIIARSPFWATAYDKNGAEVRGVFLPSGPGYQRVELASGGDIASFRVHSSGLFAMDNLVFDDLTRASSPDFRVIYSGGPLVLKPGGWGTASLTLVRLHGSRGPIRVDSWNGLDSGVSPGAVIPDPYIDPNTGVIGMTFIADGPITTLIQNKKVIATFVPDSPSAGAEPRSVTIPITVMESYDAYIIGMEVTQGVQNINLPFKPDHFRGDPVQYDGVRLAEGKKTRVRIFSAATHGAPFFRGLPPFVGFLHGFNSSSGQELPGSPVTSINGVPALPGMGSSIITVTKAIREGTSTDFILPTSWTQGVINLRAEIRPSDAFSFIPAEVYDTHPQNNVFTMTSIPFHRMNPVYVSPVWLHINPIGPITFPRVATSTVFEEARNLLPIGDNQFHCPDYYSKSIDITDIFNDMQSDKGKAISIATRLRDSADDWEILHWNVETVGVHSGDTGGAIRPYTSGTKRFFFAHPIPGVSVVQSYGRPLSSVAHELGHLLGRKHASGFGPAADPEPWPNACGLIDSVGVDCRSGAVFFPNDTCAGGAISGFYDYMSYHNEPLIWTSTKGWEAGFTHQTAGSGAVRSAKRLHLLSDEQVHEQLISVHLTIDPEGKVAITKVAPLFNMPATSADPESPITVTIISRDSKQLVRTKTQYLTGLCNDVTTFHKAIIPIKSYENIGAVHVHHGSELVASRKRSLHPPQIKDVRIKPDNSDKPTEWVVTWKATHHEGMPLLAKVDISVSEDAPTLPLPPPRSQAEDHKTLTPPSWKPIFVGPNKDVTHALPNSLFPANDKCKVRVRISDGFEEVSATSAVFSAPGSPPVVIIRSPRTSDGCCGGKVNAGCVVEFSGEAWGDNLVKLGGVEEGREQEDCVENSERMWWCVDGEEVGEGETAEWKTKIWDVGTRVITLMARDRRGRIGSKDTRVQVLRGGG